MRIAIRLFIRRSAIAARKAVIIAVNPIVWAAR
jgi:hypothetical protein